MYTIFDEQHKGFEELPRNGSLINFSLLRDLKTEPVIFRSFSIKYVLDGCERYSVNGNTFNVTNGQYLLANSFSQGSVQIDSERLVKGICIDVAPTILSEVVANFLRPDTLTPDLDLDQFFTSPDFFENCYPAEKTEVGLFLGKLGTELIKSPFEKHEFSQEFYFNLAEKIVIDHVPINRQLQSIQTVKTETKKELLRRLMKGKAFIDHSFVLSISMELVARESGLSEYHFFRLFKAVFLISPHQYLIKKRLDMACVLLKKGNECISEIALLCGYADVFSFSKVFKKHIGVAPSVFV